MTVDLDLGCQQDSQEPQSPGTVANPRERCCKCKMHRKFHILSRKSENSLTNHFCIDSMYK